MSLLTTSEQVELSLNYKSLQEKLLKQLLFSCHLALMNLLDMLQQPRMRPANLL